MSLKIRSYGRLRSTDLGCVLDRDVRDDVGGAGEVAELASEPVDALARGRLDLGLALDVLALAYEGGEDGQRRAEDHQRDDRGHQDLDQRETRLVAQPHHLVTGPANGDSMCCVSTAVTEYVCVRPSVCVSCQLTFGPVSNHRS